MTNKSKYIFKSQYHEDILRYKVSIKSNENHGMDIVVKDTSQMLNPEFLNEKVLTIKDDGWKIKVKTEHQEFYLDPCEESYLLAALMVRTTECGCDITLKKKE